MIFDENCTYLLLLRYHLVSFDGVYRKRFDERKRKIWNLFSIQYTAYIWKRSLIWCRLINLFKLILKKTNKFPSSSSCLIFLMSWCFVKPEVNMSFCGIFMKAKCGLKCEILPLQLIPWNGVVTYLGSDNTNLKIRVSHFMNCFNAEELEDKKAGETSSHFELMSLIPYERNGPLWWFVFFFFFCSCAEFCVMIKLISHCLNANFLNIRWMVETRWNGFVFFSFVNFPIEKFCSMLFTIWISFFSFGNNCLFIQQTQSLFFLFRKQNRWKFKFVEFFNTVISKYPQHHRRKPFNIVWIYYVYVEILPHLFERIPTKMPTFV